MKLEDVGPNYARAAKLYDPLLRAFSAVVGDEDWRSAAIDCLGDLQGKRVLDLGCGTGVNLAALVSATGPDGAVVGLDYSEDMLARARAKVRAAGWTNVELIRGDAVRLEGVAGTFDAILSTYCFGILYDIEAAVEAAVDRLTPGGHLAILDFARARPDRGPMHYLYPVYAPLLRWWGLSGPEDLDDVRLQDHWARGRAALRRRLAEYHEERFHWGSGMLICGVRSR